MVHRSIVPWKVWALPVALSLAGCQSGRAPGAAQEGAEGEATAPAAGNPPAEKAPEPPSGNEAKGNVVEWPATVKWNTWSEGLALARASSKPIMVVVYADWCSKCRSLTPVFADPEVVILAKQFVMVRQNHDEDPEWLKEHAGALGNYVPRIFFFDSKGKLREDVTSGHPRYPYFYAAQQPEFLKLSMRRAAGA